MVTGCASITKGTTQTLIFNLDAPESRCVLTREGNGELGSVNKRLNTIVVSKDKDDIIVKCEAPGYASKTLRLVSSTETMGVVGGAFIDLGITDMITGAMWVYPQNTNVVLEKCANGATSC